MRRPRRENRKVLLILCAYSPLIHKVTIQRKGTKRPHSRHWWALTSRKNEGEKVVWKEFKAFVLRGNVIDLAVAVVIGAAFGKIVTALVDNVIMPCIGILTAGVDFADMKIVLQKGELDAAGEVLKAEVAIGYGVLINAVLQFLIVAFVIFLIVKGINIARAKSEALAKKEKAEAPAAPAPDIALLTEIRDLLKKD